MYIKKTEKHVLCFILGMEIRRTKEIYNYIASDSMSNILLNVLFQELMVSAKNVVILFGILGDIVILFGILGENVVYAEACTNTKFPTYCSALDPNYDRFDREAFGANFYLSALILQWLVRGSIVPRTIRS